MFLWWCEPISFMSIFSSIQWKYWWFTDLDISNRIFYSSIFDNIFEYTSHHVNKCGCIWYNYTIQKVNSLLQIVSLFLLLEEILIQVYSNDRGHIVFRDCEFIDCGEIGNDRPIVNILQKHNSIDFWNCNFSYENP